MKKFSKYTNSPVGEEPKKKSSKIDEQDLFKVKILNLMDDFLKVQTYGPITRYQVAGTMKVAGKELFLEALMDLLNSKNDKNDIKLLESLKSDIKNHEFIDNKIEEIKSKNNNLYNQRSRIKSLCERYDDEEIIIEKVKRSLDKISLNERKLRSLACDELMETKINKSLLEKIKNIYQ